MKSSKFIQYWYLQLNHAPSFSKETPKGISIFNREVVFNIIPSNDANQLWDICEKP
jgi:hypothetical protein